MTKRRGESPFLGGEFGVGGERQPSLPINQKLSHPNPAVLHAVCPDGKLFIPSKGSSADDTHFGLPSESNE